MTDDELYDRCRHPSIGRRVLSAALFHAVDAATGIAVGGVVGLLFLAAGLTGFWAAVVAIAITVAITRVSVRAWERAAGLTRVRSTHESSDDDTDDTATAEPARTSDSPKDVAAAR